LGSFYQNSEIALLTAIMQNRLDVSINIKLKDTPTGKAY
jgi:hypothetical protein